MLTNEIFSKASRLFCGTKLTDKYELIIYKRILFYKNVNK